MNPILVEPHIQDPDQRRKPRNDAATGASAAGVRALSAQMVAFYFRAPVKAFFRTRVDYMAFARAVNPRVAEGKWSLHTTTPGLLLHAVRTYGWKFIPNQVLPPLLANAGVGAVLYTSYLQVLGALHEPVSQGAKRVWPPAPPSITFMAGFAAGTIQSIVAAPLDALQVRLQTSEMLKGHYRSMWHYGHHKLKQIGLRGVFAGWSLSFLRDSFGYAVFFSSFEYVKSQAYYSFITWYYGSLRADHIPLLPAESSGRGVPSIKPHYALEPCFLMMAGVVASVAQQAIQHPLSRLQDLHLGRLEYLDHQASLDPSRRQMFRLYYHAYQETFKRCERKAMRAGGWRPWLFRGFVSSSLRQVPSTSAGLVIFELVRRRYASLADAVHIQKDGYDILLAALQAPSTAIILSPTSPRAIPLRSLSRSPSQTITAFESASEKGSRRSSHSSTLSGPDFSILSDTGDLAEQLEDPLRSRLYPSFESGNREVPIKGRRGLPKRVHYQQASETSDPGLTGEKIEPPTPPPRHISRIERGLASIMSPNNRQKAQMHGLVGKPLLYFTSVFVSLGVFLFGYDQGVMSGIITGFYFGEYFNQPSRATIGTVVAILEVGAFVSSLMVGRIGDLIGRRRTIFYGSIVFFIGGLLQALAANMVMMMVGRVIAGLGVGALSTIVPVYQSEISPPPQSWETGLWLLDNDHDEEGMVVIANLYGEGDIHNENARQEYREIKMGVILQRQEGERSYSDMFRRYYKRVLIAMSAQALAQLNGINVISYYAPLVFESAGWKGRDAILMTGINGISYLLSSVPPCLSTAANWAFNWLVGEVTPVLQSAIKWRLYLVHAFFCACSFVVVYFLYPETSGVRLEDMNLLFGDATTAMPTPATEGERGSLMGAGSPVPSFDIRRPYGPVGAESAIPGLDIDPPFLSHSHDGPSKPGLSSSHHGSARGEGIGGWISKMVKRQRSPSGQRYRRLEQGDDGEEI
ncbi:Mitochondrial substrate/solute carrier [Penicillium chermesinum]|uniref:Mitochondrial substrate/solute carrier n=1 Tax=Penicillium chermesinum TaxID=63820 RepID=A0A9W9NYH4_9EURO|nr:Mitochondrial substrate/solute carrier [Penicillium chermesinum]KAJ5231965.1 Mitochondrial substrate/solute carrier [Penicillium chermesinum]